MTRSPCAETTTIASGFSFLESPRWHEGALYASDFYSQRVLRFDASGTHETVCSVPGRPSGLGFSPDGSLLVTSMLNRAVMRWDGRRMSTHAQFGSLITGYANDMLVTPEGWALVGSFGNSDDDPDSLQRTGLVRISPDGVADVIAPGLVFPNGIVFMPSHAEIIVAETFAARLSAFDYSVGADGRPELGAGRTWKQFGEAPEYLDIARATRELEVLPDGLAVDADCAVWVASSNSHAALRVSSGGEILESIDVGELSVYSLALGGADGRTLFMCCSPPLGTNDPRNTNESVLMAARVDAPAA